MTKDKELVNKIKAINNNNGLDDNNKSLLTLANQVEVLNKLAENSSTNAFRLSIALKRRLILQRIDNCQSNKDFVMLMRLLDEIDKAEDKSQGAFKDQHNSFGWTDSTIDAETTS